MSAMAVAPYCKAGRQDSGKAVRIYKLVWSRACTIASYRNNIHSSTVTQCTLWPYLDKEAVQTLLHKLLEGGQAGVAQQAVQMLVQNHLLTHACWWVVELQRNNWLKNSVTQQCQSREGKGLTASLRARWPIKQAWQ